MQKKKTVSQIWSEKLFRNFEILRIEPFSSFFHFESIIFIWFERCCDVQNWRKCDWKTFIDKKKSETCSLDEIDPWILIVGNFRAALYNYTPFLTASVHIANHLINGFIVIFWFATNEYGRLYGKVMRYNMRTFRRFYEKQWTPWANACFFFFFFNECIPNLHGKFFKSDLQKVMHSNLNTYSDPYSIFAILHTPYSKYTQLSVWVYLAMNANEFDIWCIFQRVAEKFLFLQVLSLYLLFCLSFNLM